MGRKDKGQSLMQEVEKNVAKNNEQLCSHNINLTKLEMKNWTSGNFIEPNFNCPYFFLRFQSELEENKVLMEDGETSVAWLV